MYTLEICRRVLRKAECFGGVLFLLVALPSWAEQEIIQKDCATLSAPNHYPDYGSTPKYSIEHRNYDAASPPALDLQISVGAEALGGSGIVRLACKLEADFPSEKAIHALIFDDKTAAHNLALYLTDQRHHGTYLWHLRAHYELNREKKVHFVEYLVPVAEDDLFNAQRVRIQLSLP